MGIRGRANVDGAHGTTHSAVGKADGATEVQVGRGAVERAVDGHIPGKLDVVGDRAGNEPIGALVCITGERTTIKDECAGAKRRIIADLHRLSLVNDGDAGVIIGLIEHHRATTVEHGHGVALHAVIDRAKNDVIGTGELVGHVQVEDTTTTTQTIISSCIGSRLVTGAGGHKGAAGGKRAGEVGGAGTCHTRGRIGTTDAAKEAGTPCEGVLIDGRVEACHINADDATEGAARVAVVENQRGGIRERPIVTHGDSSQTGEITVHDKRAGARDVVRIGETQGGARLNGD